MGLVTRPRAALAGALLVAAPFALAAPLRAALSSGSSGSPGPAGAVAQDHAPVGYTDTPLLPDGKWHVHDSGRPHPRAITPGTASTPEQPGRPPSDAIVLFDGKDLAQWRSADGKSDAKWKVEGGYAEVNGTGSIETKQGFGDCQLHVEWMEPNPPSGESQGRGNSGVFLMQRYEIQVLDCFQNVTYADGQTASIYGQKPPLVNACRPAGEWQSYDLVFEAPRFEGEKLAKPARVTVFHNGVLVHHAQELLGATQHRAVATYAPHADRLPIQLQDHGNPVRYRNLWIRELGRYDEPEKGR